MEKTGVDWNDLKELNPSYKRNYLPTSESGNFLILPDFAMDTFQNWKGQTKIMVKTPKNWEEHYSRTRYTVLVGDSMEKLAKIYNCSVWDIMEWNGLTSNRLYHRQEIVLYHKKVKTTGVKRA